MGGCGRREEEDKQGKPKKRKVSGKREVEGEMERVEINCKRICLGCFCCRVSVSFLEASVALKCETEMNFEGLLVKAVPETVRNSKARCSKQHQNYERHSVTTTSRNAFTTKRLGLVHRGIRQQRRARHGLHVKERPLPQW